MSAPEEIKPRTEMFELQQIDTNKPGLEGAAEPEPERTKLQTLKVYRKSVMFCLMASFGATMDGFQTTIPGNIIANPGFIEQFGTRLSTAGVRSLDPSHVSAWGGLFSGGIIFTTVFAGYISDRIGRRYSLLLMTVLLAIGNTLELVARDWRVWLASRLFTGMGTGIVQTQCVVYNSEVAPVSIRGAVMSTYDFGINLGGLVGALALQIIITSGNPNDYRRALYSQWAFTGIFLIFVLLMPETPWHHARRGNEASAKLSMKRLYGNVPGYNIDREYALMQYDLAESRRLRDEAHESKWLEIFRGVNLRRFLISAAIPVHAQLSGVSLVYSYTTYFFNLAGVQDPFLSNLILSVVGISVCMTAWYTADVIGRRPTVITAALLQCGGLFGIGIGAVLTRTTATGQSLLAMACIWVVGFKGGIAPMGPSYQGETATPRLRAKTNALSQAVAQCFGLIFNYCTPLMLDAWEVKTAWFYFGTCLVSALGLWLLLPEYKGRTYLELDEMFAARVPARRFKGYDTTVQHTVLAA